MAVRGNWLKRIGGVQKMTDQQSQIVELGPDIDNIDDDDDDDTGWDPGPTL
jgi:hypothetical protein